MNIPGIKQLIVEQVIKYFSFEVKNDSGRVGINTNLIMRDPHEDGSGMYKIIRRYTTDVELAQSRNPIFEIIIKDDVRSLMDSVFEDLNTIIRLKASFWKRLLFLFKTTKI